MPLIAGPPGVLTESVKTLLDRHPPSASSDRVLVLVDPDAGHWNEGTLTTGVVFVRDGVPGDAEVVDAVLAGADAVVDASAGADELSAAVDAVARGHTLVSPTQARLLAEIARAPGGVRGGRQQLTERETELLRSIALGESVKQTALAMGISAKRVEAMQSDLFRKLAVRNRAHAVARAHALGIVT